MGYRTIFTLTVFNKDHSVIDDFDILPKIESKYDVILNDGYGCNWDKHLSNMRSFSLLYPEYYFYFSNKGYDQDDIWISFFHNGRHYEKSLQPNYPTLNEVIVNLSE